MGVADHTDDPALIRQQAEAHAVEARILERRLHELAPTERYSERQGVEQPRLEANDELGRARWAVEFEKRRRDWLEARYHEHAARAARDGEVLQRRVQGIARFSGFDASTFDALLAAGKDAISPAQLERDRRQQYDQARGEALEASEARQASRL